MSRTLARIRKAFDDPLLVRAGRNLVPTPRAVALHGEVHALVERAQSLFAPPDPPDISRLEMDYKLLTHDEILTGLGSDLMTRVQSRAPGVVLQFLAESHTETNALRQHLADLEIGVMGAFPPDISHETILQDRLVGVVRPEHPLADGPVTLDRFAQADHLSVSRRGRLWGTLDDVLKDAGYRRRVCASVPTFAAALIVLIRADLVAMVPERMCRRTVQEFGLISFELPTSLPPLEIKQAWHRRYDGDGNHRWLRDCVRTTLLGG